MEDFVFKRISLILLLGMIFSFTFVSADEYVGEEIAFKLTNPDLLTGASSSCGGGFFSAGANAISVNPALTAGEQRVMLNLSYTSLFKPSDKDSSMGAAAQLGLLVPTRWGVFSGVVDGVFCDLAPLDLDNTVELSFGFSKDITEKLYAGLSLNGGFRWGESNMWALDLNLGFMYNFGTVGFMKDFRIASSLMNVGKPYALGLPGICSPRVGVAATLFSVADGNVAGGFSADLTAPQCMNLVFDAGLQLKVAKIITVKSSWQFDMAETISGNKNFLPSVGITVNFNINTKDNQFMADKGWQQSEISTSAAWQQIYQDIHCVSAGAAINLGMKDVDAPEIILWGDE